MAAAVRRPNWAPASCTRSIWRPRRPGSGPGRLVRPAGDPVAAGAMTLEAGTGLSLWDGCFPRLEEAVRRGLADESTLDTAVGR